jgi:Uma2 family endonuclease
MGLAAEKLEKRCTYGDYLTWTGGERWELIDGYAYAMSPAPLTEHQRVERNLAWAIESHLKGKPCEMLFAPTDVRLPNPPDEPDEEIDTVVQPDILVVCDPAKIDKKGVRGVPDFIIEILSPSTAKLDFNEKFRLYERSGVREYWIVDPANHCIHSYRMENSGRFSEEVLISGKSAVAAGAVLEGFSLPLSEVFRMGV